MQDHSWGEKGRLSLAREVAPQPTYPGNYSA